MLALKARDKRRVNRRRRVHGDDARLKSVPLAFGWAVLADGRAGEASRRRFCGVAPADPAPSTRMAFWTVVQEGRVVVSVAPRHKCVIDDVPNAVCRESLLERPANKRLALGSERFAIKVNGDFLRRRRGCGDDD